MQTSDPACQVERVIPASRRPDGTLRKPIRIRAGFRSDGDYVPFKPRVIQERDAAVAFAVQQEQLLEERLRQEQKQLLLQQQQHKVRRKRNKKKKTEVESANDGVEEIGSKLEKMTIEAGPIVLGKKLRNLRKRLSKANELHERYLAGEALSPEEFEKVYRRQDMQEEITRLEQAIVKYNSELINTK